MHRRPHVLLAVEYVPAFFKILMSAMVGLSVVGRLFKMY